MSTTLGGGSDIQQQSGELKFVGTKGFTLTLFQVATANRTLTLPDADTTWVSTADIATHAALLTGVHGLAITAGKILTVQDNVTITGTLGTGAYATIGNYAPLASPTFTGTVILPAVTLGGAIAGGGQSITNIGALTYGAACLFYSTGDNSYVLFRGGGTGAGKGAMMEMAGANHGDAGSFFFYTPNAAKAANVQRLKILGDSDASVATWAATTQTWSSYGAGAITSDASGNLTSVSDMRLKDKIGNFPLGLAQILQLQPIRFKWNNASGLDIDNTYVGFSAQEVMRYIPEAVGKQLDGYYTFNDRPIVAALVNAVKELKSEIQELRLGKPEKILEPILFQSEDRIIVSKVKEGK